MDMKFWQKQGKEALFPDILWNKPEQRTQAGNLGIIGGNKLGFYAVNRAVESANQIGIGQIRALMPDALSKSLPIKRGCELFFAPSTEIGSFSQDALPEARALADWSDFLLLIGDLSKNSQTAIFVEKLLAEQDQKPTILTRDGLEVALPSAGNWLHNPNLTIFTPMAGLIKLFHQVYYPKVLTFSMPILSLIENLHKFTLTYPVSIITIHQQANQEPQFIVAHQGRVITMSLSNARQTVLSPWLGDLAAHLSAFLIWNPGKPLEAIATGLLPK